MTIVRTFSSVVGGVIAGGLVIAACEAAGHGMLQGDAVFAATVAGYGLGAVVGSFIASRVVNRQYAMVVTGILAALAAVNFFAIPHPAWFAPTAVLLLLTGWAVGTRIADGRRAPEDRGQ